MTKILIIGTGNIGKRHLQAISNLDIDYSISCYDISEESLNSVHKFIKENNLEMKNLKLENNLDTLLSEVDKKTIIVIASTVNGRKEILKNTIEKDPLAIIVEKPVSQTDEDYLEIIKLNKEKEIPIYVNFSRHAYPDYQNILKNIKEEKLSGFISFFPNVGFGCNGSHILDLAVWLSGAKDYEITDSKVTSTFESKREGFSDFSGSLTLKLAETNCIINIGNFDTLPSIELTSENKTIKIIESLGKKITIEQGKDPKVEDFYSVPCSKMTDKVIQDILNKRKPNLPTLSESYLAHKILFEFMKKHNIGNLNIT
jgi:hypothetical protein